MGNIPESIALPLKGIKRGHDTFQVNDAQGAWVATTGDLAYAAYLAHAANAYPKLVETLRAIGRNAMDEGGEQLYVSKKSITNLRTLLRNLKEST